MISRLSASAALFAVLATTGIAFAADARQQRAAPARAAAAVVEAMPVVVLPRVEITGHRRAQNVHF